MSLSCLMTKFVSSAKILTLKFVQHYHLYKLEKGVDLKLTPFVLTAINNNVSVNFA